MSCNLMNGFLVNTSIFAMSVWLWWGSQYSLPAASACYVHVCTLSRKAVVQEPCQLD